MHFDVFSREPFPRSKLPRIIRPRLRSSVRAVWLPDPDPRLGADRWSRPKNQDDVRRLLSAMRYVLELSYGSKYQLLRKSIGTRLSFRGQSASDRLLTRTQEMKEYRELNEIWMSNKQTNRKLRPGEVLDDVKVKPWTESLEAFLCRYFALLWWVTRISSLLFFYSKNLLSYNTVILLLLLQSLF